MSQLREARETDRAAIEAVALAQAAQGEAAARARECHNRVKALRGATPTAEVLAQVAAAKRELAGLAHAVELAGIAVADAQARQASTHRAFLAACNGAAESEAA